MPKRESGLFDRVVALPVLFESCRRASRGKKHKIAVARFNYFKEIELVHLRNELLAGTYTPSPFSLLRIYEPKPRLICCSPFRDRVVHHAICFPLEEVFERRLISDTFACRKGKGLRAALDRLQSGCMRTTYFLKCDIRQYFGTISHAILKKELRRVIKDERYLKLLDQIIERQIAESKAGHGLPIGSLTSQHFANFYLARFDYFVKETLKIEHYLRYMDDFVLLSADKVVLRDALSKIRVFLKGELLLELKERHVQLAPVNQGVPFLGFRVYPATIRLQKERFLRLKKRYQRATRFYLGGGLNEEEYSQKLRSWAEFLKNGHTLRLRQALFCYGLNDGKRL